MSSRDIIREEEKQEAMQRGSKYVTVCQEQEWAKQAGYRTAKGVLTLMKL